MNYLDDIIKIPVLYDGNIYHYTSTQALLGILDNEQFWATKSDFLNDKTEFNYTYNLFEEYILKNINDELFRQKLITAFKFEIANDVSQKSFISENLSGYYVISFSTNPDNLLLWSEFSNMMGYNLEFRVDDLLKSFTKNIMWHGKVIYDKEVQLRCLYDAMNDSLTWRPEYYSKKSINDFDKYTSDSIITDLAFDFYAFCTAYSMFFKHAAFTSEEEYRFIFSAFHEEKGHIKKTVKMHFRVKDDVLIPYIIVPCKSLSALQSITIGPKNDIDVAMTGIQLYCREKRIDVSISKSILPLRY